MITHITDHDAQGQARLISQYQKAPVFKTWLSTLMGRIQILEDAIWAVIVNRNIDGVGFVLDNIGKIIKRPRGGLGDDDYRIALRAEIAILRSNGTTPDIIAVSQLGLPPGYTFDVTDQPIQTLLYLINEPILFDVGTFFTMLKRTKAGGVKLLFEYTINPLEDDFTWTAGPGWDDSISNIGGPLISAQT